MINFLRGLILFLLFFSLQGYSAEVLMTQQIFDSNGNDLAVKIERIKDLLGDHQELALYDSSGKRVGVFSANGLAYLTLYQTGEGGDLATVWGGGSGYEIVLFSVNEGKLVKKFSEGSKYFPEFIRLTHEEELSIVITHTKVLSTGNKMSYSIYSSCHGVYVKGGEFSGEKKFARLNQARGCVTH